jgi:carboxyl-terminal processing protease
VVDLRGNAGGFLQAAVEISSHFIDEGEVIVREHYGDKREPRVQRSQGYGTIPDTTDVAVLVNGGSASAAEIMAGALRDQGVAKLVGSQTFGKGSVQELVDLTDKTALKVTVARWLTPNGNSISEGGLTPDVEVEMNEQGDEQAGTTDDSGGPDAQLERAIQVITDQ